MNSPKIIPVIHFRDRMTAISETAVARGAGADGVFLISHLGDDNELVDVAKEIKLLNPEFPIGINLLSRSALDAVQIALDAEMDMVWADSMGVDSTGVTDHGEAISAIAKANPGLLCFASVAFKYQPNEPRPQLAANRAKWAGFIPTTSDTATGAAAPVEKITSMSASTDRVLAVASGVTPENVNDYAPYLSHILVATGIALNEHEIDAAKLLKLISAVRHGDNTKAIET